MEKKIPVAESSERSLEEALLDELGFTDSLDLEEMYEERLRLPAYTYGLKL